ncbi:LuxR C-terminal-related transcriptional regulator [Microlunatus ginsengisoli]|uniref:LuxR family transcriptional regulator n=1 Tax=Microlunatus ginsengisoli TaxID=363863 RepID=A0ABP7AIN3_9ACTN
MLDRVRAPGPGRAPVPVRRLRPPSELVDRDPELETLGQAWADALAGRARVVVVEAEAGMGKSALLEDFVGQLDDRAVHWLRCDEFERDIAFAGAERLLGGRIRLVGCSEVEVGRRLLAWFGESQRRTGALVLAVDDAQWLDLPSARSLAFALRRLRADRVLALVARRDGADRLGRVLTEDPAATSVVRLAPLNADAVTRLARRLRDWDLPGSSAGELVDRTHGVPLLVAEAIRGAARPDELVGGRRVSWTVTAMAARMLAQLDPATRALVEAAAVLAEPADVVVLGRLAEIDDPSVALASGLSAGLIRIDDDGAAACAHDLLQDAIYRAIPLPRRRALHRRAVELTLGDRRLGHLAAACDQPDPDLVVALIDAAVQARRQRRYALAAAHRLRARAVCGDPELRNQLLLEAILDRVSAQDLAGADELAPLVDPSAGGALRPLALGLLARESGRVQPARHLLREALDRALADQDAELSAAAGVAQAVLDVRLNEGRAAVDSAGWALDSADPELAADARTNQALAWWQRGEFEQALAVLDGATSPAADAPWDADIIAVRGVVGLYAGQWPEALADFDAAVALDPVWRPSTNHCQSRVLRAKTRQLLGDWDGAAVDCAVARTLAKTGAQVWNIPLAYGQSIDVPAWRGQFETAADYLAEVDASLRVLTQAQVLDVVVDHRLTLAMARDEPDAVIDLLTPLWPTGYLDRVGIIRVHRWSQQCWIVAHLERGDLAEAERALDRYRATLERWPGGIVPHRLGWLQGRLAEARGEPIAARDHYASDLLSPETRRTPYQLAEVLLALGRLERVLGNRREALDHLGQAREIFARLRAAPAETRCTAELAACGLQVTLSDPLRLTPREEDVASLVARGYTNKEVAAELFLTPKTVEFHLGKIYAKLGIRTRGELRRLRTGR